MSSRTMKTGSVLLLDVLKRRTATLFEAPVDVVTCSRLEEVDGCLRQLERAQQDGYHCAGYLAYELGYAFEEKLKTRFEETGEPLLWFGLYEERQDLTLDEAFAVLNADTADAPRNVSKPSFDMAIADYENVFSQVQDHLSKGDIYQVNLTLRARFGHQGAPELLFQDLLKRQPVEFAAFMKLEDRTALSLSPELFLERTGTTLRTRPMKGTEPRGRFASEDARIARDLAQDPKQRSENIMIVDLMRNDLSRIAETGTVQVTKLCDVERYQSVQQMTSTIEAQVPATTGFADIIRHLFPCGSITGAPKLSAMQIAHNLETAPRGVYTGSIGFLTPTGDFCLNVAIRTLVLRQDGTGEIGTGSGVVFDSKARPEYDECALKLKFMTEDLPEFDLIETMAYDPDVGYLLLERHMQRLQKSAEYFGFQFDLQTVLDRLETAGEIYRGPQRVRLLLSRSGDISISATELPPADRGSVFNLMLATETTRSSDRFLYHKTTNRSFYDETRIRYQAETGCQEVIFLNESGYLTEGSYTTLFLKIDGKLLTPALEHGVLPGTFREGLLEAGYAVEADLTPEDLERAEAVFVGNSVRGLVRARMIAAEKVEPSSPALEGIPLQVTRRLG
ncbi:aminodeoxychorismate synthase component I [Roseibium alexandrii]|uniref:Probable branched-chain-amino-acid aminotransferase n=1 Tax=Roseibium alexandrii TaxID=388408 RepID=A0A0M6ZST1_9HYPH|nr:aminodeoxychorismate synthase component I [Roseibium alexandrii]CTQ65377.1 Para-aminobenzoate synthase component 1 [Roseibium alexandrii]